MSRVIPLSRAAEGKYRVVSLNGGKGFIRRIAELGIYPNSTLEVSAYMNGGGPISIIVKGSKLALGRGMAAKIMVKKEE